MKTPILKVSTMIACLGFLMSSTKCSQPAPETRQLKKNIRVIQMSASTALDSSGFNFSQTAQNQLSGVFFDKNYFYERTVYPDPYATTADSVQSNLGISKASMDKVRQWFPVIKKENIALSQDSACLITRPQHYIAGTINALEAYSGTSLQFGFNSTAVVPIPLSGHIGIDKMRMDLSFHAIDPWTNQIVSSVNTEAFKKDYKAGFGIDLGIIHIGPEFYRTTGMAEVTLNGLKTGVETLANSLLSKPNQEWASRIILSRDNYVLILGGAELGIKKGDQFAVYNQVHTWVGEPCGTSSVLSGSVIVSDVQDPWIVEVEDAGDLMSKARVLNPKESISINTGALVKLHQFAAVSADQTQAK